MPDDLDFGATVRGFSPGQKVFGRYTLTRILGRGGMGVVWLARDGHLERDVALKFLPEVLAHDAESVADLKRETRRALSLTHPRIVRIYDFIDDARSPAISMEYVSGSSLSLRKLDQPKRCFGVAEIARWTEQACEALAYAHGEARVVHRDLKPANLMLDENGNLKVADFGISATLSDSTTRLSQRSGTSGSPPYMSPQQMLGKAPAPTDDLYALGATLYELLTGKPPFFSGNIELQAMQVVPPSMAERRAELGVVAGVGDPGIPAVWEETVAACLAKEAGERPQSAGELWERLKGGKTEKLKGGNAESITTEGAENTERLPRAGTEDTERKSGESGEKAAGGAGKRMGVGGWLVAGLVAVMVGLAVGWWFGAHVPEQRRLESERFATEALQAEAEVAQIAAERERVATAGDESFITGEPQWLLRSLATGWGPQEGERFTVPDVGIELLPIAPGTFQMGSASGGESNERPVTVVTLSRPYWLGRTEVTQRQWETLMGNNPSKFKGSSLPVEQVSWNDVAEFGRKLTERERAAGRLPEGYVYTLPTEAQWEYAARAGTTGDYAGDLNSMAWYESGSGGSTKPVGTKQANAWGLHDMHGNVWEWCLDWYGNYPGDAVNDPRGPSSGSSRVNRGGSWGNAATACRSAFRVSDGPDYRLSFLGFRVALSLSP